MILYVIYNQLLTLIDFNIYVKNVQRIFLRWIALQRKPLKTNKNQTNTCQFITSFGLIFRWINPTYLQRIFLRWINLQRNVIQQII